MGFCDDTQKSSTSYNWQDPLGPTSLGPGGSPRFSATGAPQLRSSLFNYLGSYLPQMTQSGAQYASALRGAAANPGWGQAADLAQNTLSGNYLNGSPALDRAMAVNRARAMADAADQVARIKSGYAKNGMAYGTVQQQAEQSARATANANAERTNAQTYLQNYLAERGNQNNGANMLATATGMPLNYLGQVSGAYTSPLSQAGNLLSGLSSGGQVFQTGQSGVYSPSMGSNILNGMTAANSMASQW